MTTYNQHDLIQAYIAAQRRPYPHEDFRTFRRARLAALERAFDVSISDEGTRTAEGRILFFIFRGEVAAQVDYLDGGAGVLEGGLLETVIDRNDTPELGIREKQQRIHSLTAQCAQERLALIETLFSVIWGKTDRTVSSADLLAFGFDDSDEPKVADYWDMM